jgi:hypothetical protein
MKIANNLGTTPRWVEEVREAEFKLFKQETTAASAFFHDLRKSGFVFHVESAAIRLFIKEMGYLFTASPDGSVVHIINQSGQKLNLVSVLEELVAAKPFLLKERRKPKRQRSRK